jgi:hypothetical protein
LCNKNFKLNKNYFSVTHTSNHPNDMQEENNLMWQQQISSKCYKIIAHREIRRRKKVTANVEAFL